ncbi:Uncharacterised protein [Mycobacterium tuberculosis]|uniref:Uncharacterized protein n=1 Tax=Mycobacterium tuberculosis TaxID=1773 RepID=A0A655A3G6_MYCTX|nr:Uncharacterised protein [Mycobacterium tuberculosis]CFR99315.1 Uncharacterised protein [Mycobacterium tuberculosis]CKM70728.1 Uncharacterised protein [Mycobacterium tuberculosis]CKP10985.1 Uncharacterised protein [Mycobacterium tuberculosis]CKR11536.1 Uncharacterised protein [Mycobacterium tuberculosis]
MTALIKTIACMFTARPNSASPDNVPCAVTTDAPMVASGTSMVTRFR